MENYAGIDIAKHSFDLHSLNRKEIRRFDSNSMGMRQATRMLTQLGPKLVVMEATGGYETPLAAELHAAGLPVAIVNPRRIRDFAKARGRLAKTDKIDAEVTATFAAKMRPPAQEQIDHVSRLMKALVARRHQLIRMRTAGRLPCS